MKHTRNVFYAFGTERRMTRPSEKEMSTEIKVQSYFRRTEENKLIEIRWHLWLWHWINSNSSLGDIGTYSIQHLLVGKTASAAPDAAFLSDFRFLDYANPTPPFGRPSNKKEPPWVLNTLLQKWDCPKAICDFPVKVFLFSGSCIYFPVGCTEEGNFLFQLECN